MLELTYSTPNAFGQEGVDHINISNQSTMQLGLILNPSYMKVVDYPYIGKFASVSNLWYWLKASPLDDGLRRAHGKRLREKLSHANTKNKVGNFKAIIAYATYMKLIQYPHCVQQLKALPDDVVFISYYIPKGTGVRMCSNYIAVIHEVVEFIREAVVNGVEPDFSKLADIHDDGSFNFLRPFLVTNFGEARLAEFNSTYRG